MWRSLAVVAALCAVACGGSSSGSITPPPPPPQKQAVDPVIRIHLFNKLDAGTAMAGANWQVFALIYSQDSNQAGVAFWSSPNQKGELCRGFGSDSLGQRFVIVLALADTVHPTVDATAASVAQAWYTGNHALPAGWASMATDSVDWGASQQFNAGHGQTVADPIRWSLTWTSPATATRAESPNDLTCA